MIWDEAVAAVELDEQFWAELRTAETKFLWLPKYNYLTGRLMWLRNAVCAISGRVLEVSDGPYSGRAKIEFTHTRWYKPKDFVIEKLKRG